MIIIVIPAITVHKSSRFHGLLVISSGYKVISISCEGGAAGRDWWCTKGKGKVDRCLTPSNNNLLYNFLCNNLHGYKLFVFPFYYSSFGLTVGQPSLVFSLTFHWPLISYISYLSFWFTTLLSHFEDYRCLVYYSSSKWYMTAVNL